ncbi:glycosyltransferase [Nocardia sp. CDC159]|uniref:Glycosyltransferase n=1 Tax=Nocardia pulmonis TaxID=2951408 RepID=A0A9X2E8Q8_9NOCA|nr:MULTISPECIES: glycosyltransferase [Nocardia]MCM6773806.1 glycosyltransferase [Nocardia pulmonis]MCM6786693.1 glycosyltransferase [Nocardia sp. CDC159]
MPQPTVSIVIPTHLANPADLALLDVQLAALAAQTFDGPFEVLVADNNSAVDLRSHVAAHPLRARLSLRYVDAGGPRGAAHARNAGAAVATGEILLFCDHDDRVYPQWAARLVEFLEQDLDVVGSAVEGRSLNRPRAVADVPPPERFQAPGLFAPQIVGGSMGVRAQVYRKLGGLDVGYAANEDVEFGWRAHREGYRVGFLPEALVAYRYRHGFRAGYRQGRPRGRTLARLQGEYPDSGMPPIRLPLLLLTLVVVGGNPRLTGEERGLLLGITVGQLRGGLRYRTLRLW